MTISKIKTKTLGEARTCTPSLQTFSHYYHEKINLLNLPTLYYIFFSNLPSKINRDLIILGKFFYAGVCFYSYFVLYALCKVAVWLLLKYILCKYENIIGKPCWHLHWTIMFLKVEGATLSPFIRKKNIYQSKIVNIAFI